jgi:uncharacterized protein YchJ
MNVNDGKLVDMSIVEFMLPEEKAKYVEVKRELTALEEAERQIKMYSPCGCGSGKKFKFCCYQKILEI